MAGGALRPAAIVSAQKVPNNVVKSPAVAEPKMNPSKTIKGLAVPPLHGLTGGGAMHTHGIKISVAPQGTPKGL